VDGRLTLGRCKKVTDLEREFMPYDFIIILNRDFWEDERVTDHQRRALLDHELCHAAVATDREGDPRVDEKNRVVYRTRKHTLEEFHEIVDRYGLYKQDLEEMWRTMCRAQTAKTKRAEHAQYYVELTAADPITVEEGTFDPEKT
jgi:hypothetical protein